MNEILLGNLSETNVSSHGNYSSDVRQYNNWQMEAPVDEEENAMDDDFNPGASFGQAAAFDAAMPLDQAPPYEQSSAFEQSGSFEPSGSFEQSVPFEQSSSGQPEFDWSGTGSAPEPEEFTSELAEEQPWLPADAGEWIPDVGSDWAKRDEAWAGEPQAPGQSQVSDQLPEPGVLLQADQSPEPVAFLQHDESPEQVPVVEPSLEPSELELAYGMIESPHAQEHSEVSKLALAESSLGLAVPPPEASYFTASFLEEQDGGDAPQTNPAAQTPTHSTAKSSKRTKPSRSVTVDDVTPAAPLSFALPAGETPLVAALRIAFASGIQPGVAGHMPSLAPTNAAFSLPSQPLPETIVSAVTSFAPTNVTFSAGVPVPAAAEAVLNPLIDVSANADADADADVAVAGAQPISVESRAADTSTLSNASGFSDATAASDEPAIVEAVPTFDLGEEPIGEVVIFEESLHGATQTANGVEQAAPLSDIYRTRRGTIELVIHKDGRMITPQYNNCGILTGVDLGNGSTLQRPVSTGFWRVLDAQGVEQPSIDIKAVTFDKHGTLWAITAAGDRLKVSADGFDAK